MHLGARRDSRTSNRKVVALPRRLTETAEEANRLPPHTTADTLFEPQWLLTYEGAVQGWLPTAVPAVSADPYFGPLLKRKIHFFDPGRAPTPIFTVKAEAGRPPEDLLDSDANVYEHFDFADTDEDYLGRRIVDEDDDDDE